MTGQGLTVWYNTRCPVCDAGIDWQRNKLLAAVRAGHLSFRDINEEPAALAAYGASLDDVRRRLHATDESGRLIVGADVAIAMWQLTPGEGWLASLFGNRLTLRPRVFSMIGLRMCCSPGISGRGIDSLRAVPRSSLELPVRRYPAITPSVILMPLNPSAS